MIPQVGLMELFLIGALALIVVGPKDLPLMMRKIGQLWSQARGLAREFQTSFEELGRQAEIESLRKEVEALKRGEPVKDVKDALEATESEMMAPLDAPEDAKGGESDEPAPPTQDGRKDSAS